MSVPANLLVLATALVAPVAFAAAPKPDIENGQEFFTQVCGICHSATKEPGGPVLGPNLVGVVGRKAGTLPGFATYTPALKAYGVKWSAKTLDEFLVNPAMKVPGTLMAMPVPDPQTRADLIAYLATLK
ncbi:MAG: c-type cytochrome [Steroidobacteraceae bacterium]